MNLAILTQYYPPEVGAPQARLSSLARHFSERGHSVNVITAMPNYPSGKIHKGYGGVWKSERQDGVNIIRLPIWPTQKADFVRRLSSYFSFVLSSAIGGSLWLKKMDYLLVESPPLFLGLSGVWLSRLKGAKLIFNVSDLWPESAVRMGILDPHSLAFRLSTRLEQFCYRNAWAITGQSKGIVASIASRFPESTTFHLSNGVDVGRFGSDKYRDDVRATLANSDECVVLYAGLHGLAQGLDQVLDAAKSLERERGFRFVFVGDGPRKTELVERSRQQELQNLSFLDSRPASEIPALLAAADILLVTLKLDIPGAVPSKLYEAMASGRPVILVAEGEAATILHDHQAGLVVSPGDIGGLVQALQRLRRDSGLRQRMGENGRKAAESHFDRSSIDSRFIDFLQPHHGSSCAEQSGEPDRSLSF